MGLFGNSSFFFLTCRNPQLTLLQRFAHGVSYNKLILDIYFWFVCIKSGWIGEPPSTGPLDSVNSTEQMHFWKIGPVKFFLFVSEFYCP